MALAVSAEVKSGLVTVQQEMRDMLPSGNASWTRPENIHLTLRFLGGVDQTRIEELTASLSAGTQGRGRLHLVSERLGCFPGLRHPRILWAWVHDADDQLIDLQ